MSCPRVQTSGGIRRFAGELVDGEVWGRGALDMKGGVAMLISALLRIAADDEPPPGDVHTDFDERRGAR